MGRMARWFFAGAAFAASLGLIALGQGCAVRSSGECTDKATCIADDTGTGEPDSAGVDSPGAPDVATGDDATLEGAVGPTDGSTPDMTLPDVGVADGATTDVAPIDAGCVPTGVEDCTNGIDDNCDGKIDCDDPTCQPAFTCIPPLPSGWIGPIEFWQAANPATAPACQTDYGNPRDLHGGTFSAPAATCSCTCTPAGQVCAPTGSFFSQTTCSGTCATVTPAADGTCTQVPAGSCGSQGSFMLAGTPAPTAGTCAASAVTTNKAPATWTASARVCPYTGPADIPEDAPRPGRNACERRRPTRVLTLPPRAFTRP